MRIKTKLKKIMVLITTVTMVTSSIQLQTSANVDDQPMGANIAVGKVMTVPGATADQAKLYTDGNINGGFQVQKNQPNPDNLKEDPQDWILDLGETYSIDKVQMYWEAACAKIYNIYVAQTNDETTEWKLVNETTDGVKGETKIRFNAVDARYVKLELKERAMDYGYNLFEIQVYTVGSTDEKEVDNLALKATATATNTDGNAAHAASSVNDGKLDTMWRTDEAGLQGDDKWNQSITLAWDEAQTFTKIKAIWFNGFMKGYKFEVSDDNTTWTQIAEITDGVGADKKIINLKDAVTAKYLKLTGTELGAWCFELYEIQVFDERNIVPDAINLSNKSIKLNLDDETLKTKTLTYNINPSNAGDQTVKWSSSDESIATVENGVVTGVKAGKATITAIANGNESVTAKCEVTVTSSLPKTVVTAAKVDRTKNIEVDWQTVEGAVSYELYRKGGSETDTKVYEGTDLTFTDTDLEPGSYSYYVKAIPAATDELNGVSTSADTDAIVIPVYVTGVTLDENSIELNVGDEKTLTATVAPDNATNQKVIWSSDKEDVATVDENGKVTATGVGDAIITATTEDGEFTDTCSVKGLEVMAASVEITSKNAGVVELGEKVELEATVLPANTTNNKVAWSSSDEKIATVDDEGVVTTIATGSVTITATTSNGLTDTYELTVKIALTSIKLDKSEVTLDVGKTATLTATLLPENATDKEVVWTSDNEAVAKVSNGVITAVSAGTTNIKVATKDGKVVAVCAVKVNTVVVPTTTIKQPDTTKPVVTVKAPKKVTIAKTITKKKSATKLKVSLKKVAKAKGYQVVILTSKKTKKALVTKLTKSINVTIKSKKLKNKKKLYVKVRAYVTDAKGNKKYGAFSKIKQIKIK